MTPRADPDRARPHEDFIATVEVVRIGEGDADAGGTPKAFAADIRVTCVQCDEPFRFIGVQAGQKPDRPMCSVDETELRAPIRPASSDPDFGLGIPGFAVTLRNPGERVDREPWPPHPYDEGDHGMIA